MTPINSLNAQLEKATFELSGLIQKHNHLFNAHEKLVDDYVKQNHRTDALEISVKEMCGNCSQDGSKLCSDCPLNNVRSV